jgi:hypothetical protein
MYTMEYYSAIKNEIIFFEEKWMELEIIMLSEINQAEKDKYHIVSLMQNLQTQKKLKNDMS